MHSKVYLYISFILLLAISCATSNNLPSWVNKLPSQDGYIYDIGYAKLSSIDSSKNASRLNAISNLSAKINGKLIVKSDSAREEVVLNSKDIEMVDIRVLKDGGVWTLIRMKNISNMFI